LERTQCCIHKAQVGRCRAHDQPLSLSLGRE
jgi:hypothetical protein